MLSVLTFRFLEETTGPRHVPLTPDVQNTKEGKCNDIRDKLGTWRLALNQDVLGVVIVVGNNDVCVLVATPLTSDRYTLDPRPTIIRGVRPSGSGPVRYFGTVRVVSLWGAD